MAQAGLMVAFVAVGMGGIVLANVKPFAGNVMGGIIIRVAHLALFGAGILISRSVFGGWGRDALGWSLGVVPGVWGLPQIAQALVAVFVAALLVGWVLGFVPNVLIGFNPPDWVPLAALVFPTFKGQISDGFALIWQGVQAAGPLVADWIGGL
jgi:hypothetical protein